MKYKQLLPVLFFVLALSGHLYPQNGFNKEAYDLFLQQHQNLTTDQLLALHPAGMFENNSASIWNESLYHDSLEIKYELTADELSLINNHGFVVTERLRQNTFGEQFLDIWHNDVPVFVSSDAILHAFHMSYDRILRDTECHYLQGNLEQFLEALNSSFGALHNNYSGNPDMLPYLQDVDLFLTVGRKLLDNSAQPHYSVNNSAISELIGYIMAEEYKEIPFFSEIIRKIDFSQFKPRGHYVDQMFPELENYFRAMMWFGRSELYLLAPISDDPKPTPEDIRRQTIMSYLIRELIDIAGQQSEFDEIDTVIQAFVGEQDNVTIANLDELKQLSGFQNASSLLDMETLTTFQDTLKNQPFAWQKILSQCLSRDPFSPDSIVPASAFMLFGQRFVVDSYITGGVVYDRIEYEGNLILRMLPDLLDVLFALGNDAAGQILIPELNQYHYGTNLAALRYLVENYGPDFWDLSVYNMWLDAIRTLNPPEDRSELPPFMQTAAWWQMKLNSQLASWTELRHDNLLYAKQSYSGIPICSYPHSYVEPVPQFYARLKDMAYKTNEKLTGTGIPYITMITNYFETFMATMDTLESVAQKELEGTALTDEERSFLAGMLFETQMGCAPTGYSGWYAKMFYYDEPMGNDGLLKKDFLVADYHTSPADEGGTIIGWVAHAGTGPVELAFLAAETPDGQNVAFVGPVSSYYEYTTTNFLRLTDDEWEESYLALSLRPDWVNLYLANSEGNKMDPGTNLITLFDPEDDEPTIPATHITAQNYPNPFNPETLIKFTIPGSETGARTTLKIFDIQGREIATLVNKEIPAGNYLTKWNGRDASNHPVASGVYIYEIRCGSKKFAGKMNLLK